MSQTTDNIEWNSSPHSFSFLSAKMMMNDISIQVRDGTLEIHESRGFFRIDEKTTKQCDLSLREEVKTAESFTALLHASEHLGTLRCTKISEYELAIEVAVDPSWSRITLVFPGEPNEKIFGAGTQLSRLNLKGETLPILTREPGIGRGVQPLTFFMNRLFGAGGEWHCTSAPSAWFFSSQGFGVCVENEELSRFDFQDPKKLQVQVYSSKAKFRIFFGETPREILSRYTAWAGRFPILPDWVHQGAIIGVQGGGEKVKRIQSQLEKYEAPVAAYWLQDWVGGRKTSIGKQLWWNWELDAERYPDWDVLCSELQKKDIAVLSYINPFLVDISEKGSHKRNLLAEAREKGFLVRNQKGEPYPIQNTSFFAYLLDLSNPQACEWMKNVIVEEVLSTGVKGWMADFAEALPYDAVLHEGTPEKWHNRYPVRWAELNREAIAQAGREGDVIFFHRAGFTQTPKYSTMMWMGDQLAHWGPEDGLHSAVIGLLSSGFSGFSINHGDIGGYIATSPPNLPFSIPGFAHKRTKELLMRWAECFSCTAVFRTHEGNQPERHVQIDHDEEVLQHFARFARLYVALSSYRKELSQQAHQEGLPIVRGMALVYPDIAEGYTIDTQFFLGDDVLMCPVLHPKQAKVQCYVPSPEWILIWNQELDLKVGWNTVPAPLSQPCILVQKNSNVAKRLEEFVQREQKSG